MRKLILIIALTAVPLGIWTAGCRNEQQAAFPDTQEMRSLAKSTETNSANADLAAAPRIPEKPIDREILHYSDSGSLARAQAANDRANLYASEKAGHGLFTLPEEKNYVASAPAARRTNSRDNARGNAGSAMTVPPPSAREFWSKPVAERGRARSAAGVPEDVSAMAGPAKRGDGAVNPPAPARAARSARESIILPPDDMPGVFMAGEEEEEPPPARGWFGMLRRDRGDARGAPPASSKQAASALSAAGVRPRAEVTQRGPMKLDIEKLVDMDAAPAAPAPARELAELRFAAAAPEAFPPIAPGARIVSSEGMNFEPLPEPIPLAMHAARQSAPAPAAKRSATGEAPVLPLPAALIHGTSGTHGTKDSAPGFPELTEARTAAKLPGAVEFAKVEKALEPLPDLAAIGPTPGRTGRKDKIVVALPAPVPEVLPTPEAAAAKAALLEFSPEAMDEAFAELNRNDFFKTDFWDPAAKTQRMADAEKAPSLPVLPELADPAGLVIPMPPPFFEEEKTEAKKLEAVLPGLSELSKPAEKKRASAEPRKVTLQPVRRARAVPELEKIDSATEAPPLKF